VGGFVDALTSVVKEAKGLLSSLDGAGIEAPVEGLKAALARFDAYFDHPSESSRPPESSSPLRVTKDDLVKGEEYILESVGPPRRFVYRGGCSGEGHESRSFWLVWSGGKMLSQGYYTDFGLEEYRSTGKWHSENWVRRGRPTAAQIQELIRRASENAPEPETEPPDEDDALEM